MMPPTSPARSSPWTAACSCTTPCTPTSSNERPVSDDERSIREISNLMYRFGYLLDKADFEGIGDLLAHASFGSDLLGRAAFRGKDEIVEQFRRTSPAEGVKRTKQFYSNMIVDLDGDQATAMCNFLVLQATDTLPLQPIVCGHFEDS